MDRIAPLLLALPLALVAAEDAKPVDAAALPKPVAEAAARIGEVKQARAVTRNGHTVYEIDVAAGGAVRHARLDEKGGGAAAGGRRIVSDRSGDQILVRGPKTFVTGLGDPISVAAGDIDGDGRDDLVFIGAAIDENGLYVALSKGGGEFTEPRKYDTRNPGYALAVVDLDGDGKADVVDAGGAETDPAAAVWLNKGGGKLAKPVGFDPKGARTSQFVALAIGDVDGDGSPDAVMYDNYAQRVVLVTNNGAGKLSDGVATPATTFAGLALGDLDGDGKPDLLTTAWDNSTATGSFAVWRNEGGSFADKPVAVELNQGVKPTAIAVGDLNGDGKLDVVVGASGCIEVFLATGPLQFDDPVKCEFPGGDISNLAVVDLNNDGRADVVGHVGDDVAAFMVWTGAGDGTLPKKPRAYAGGHPNVSGCPMTTIGDFEGNGVLGFAAIDSRSGNIDVLVGVEKR